MSHRERRLLLAVLASLACLPARAQPPGPAVHNLQRAGCCYGATVVTDQLVIFPVLERDQGGADLNGSGDGDDGVAHVYDPVTQQVRNLGVAGWHFFADGRFAVFYSDESEQSQDLNGDGDQSDRVVHTYDAQTGLVTNQQLVGGYAIRDPYVAVLVDPPPFPRKIVLIDLRTGTRREIAARAGMTMGLGKGVLVWLGESNLQPTRVSVQVYDIARDEVIDLGLFVDYLQTDFQISDGVVLFRVSEFEQGLDLNGDGDLADRVVHSYDVESRTARNLGLAVRYPTSGEPPELAIDGRLAAVRVWERDQGRDLDGDGDQEDFVLHRVAIDEKEPAVNLGLATWRFFVEGSRIALVDYRATLWLDEGAGPFVVAHKTWNVVMTPRLLAFAVNEDHVGPDLNGDGDVLDRVAHVLDFEWRRPANLALATWAWPVARDGVVIWSIDENSQGASDLNGDGRVNTRVAFAYREGAVTNLARAVDTAPALGDRFALFEVPEQAQGSVDLNADGDSRDDVFHLVFIDQL